MPRGWDPRALLGATVAVVLAFGALVVARVMRRRRVRTAAGAAPPDDGADLDYQDRLEDELLALD